MCVGGGWGGVEGDSGGSAMHGYQIRVCLCVRERVSACVFIGAVRVWIAERRWSVCVYAREVKVRGVWGGGGGRGESSVTVANV